MDLCITRSSKRKQKYSEIQQISENKWAEEFQPNKMPKKVMDRVFYDSKRREKQEEQ